jgi:hypothetical protein
LCTLRNPVDQFFLSNCCHRLPHFRKEQLGNWILVTLKKLLYNIPTLISYPTAHHTPLRTLRRKSNHPGGTLRSKNSSYRPQNRPTKRKLQNTATHYTTTTSIRQGIFSQFFPDSEKK